MDWTSTLLSVQACILYSIPFGFVAYRIARRRLRGGVFERALVAGTVWVASLVVLLYLAEAPLRSRLNDLRPLVEGCKSLVPVDSARVQLKGKALVWSVEGWRSMRASETTDLDGPTTVFMVREERLQVGTYSVTGKEAFQGVVDICVIYWPEKKIGGRVRLSGEPPRQHRPLPFLTPAKPESGEDPDISAWINELPRDQ